MFTALTRVAPSKVLQPTRVSALSSASRFTSICPAWLSLVVRRLPTLYDPSLKIALFILSCSAGLGTTVILTDSIEVVPGNAAHNDVSFSYGRRTSMSCPTQKEISLLIVRISNGRGGDFNSIISSQSLVTSTATRTRPASTRENFARQPIASGIVFCLMKEARRKRKPSSIC